MTYALEVSNSGGQGGAVWLGESVATPGQFAESAAKRCWYARMVWREMPVMRSISRCVAPPLSSVRGL